MAQKRTEAQQDKQKHSDPKNQKTQQPGFVPKTESTSEFEGASDRQPTGNDAVEEKVESSSESGQ